MGSSLNLKSEGVIKNKAFVAIRIGVGRCCMVNGNVQECSWEELPEEKRE